MIFKQLFINTLGMFYLYMCTSQIYGTIIIKEREINNLRGSKGEDTKEGQEGGDMGKFERRKGKEKSCTYILI